jgi:hypothetical protein
MDGEPCAVDGHQDCACCGQWDASEHDITINQEAADLICRPTAVIPIHGTRIWVETYLLVCIYVCRYRPTASTARAAESTELSDNSTWSSQPVALDRLLWYRSSSYPSRSIDYQYLQGIHGSLRQIPSYARCCRDGRVTRTRNLRRVAEHLEDAGTHGLMAT